MAFSYSENLANFEQQWTFRQSFDESSWMSSIHETETLTKALQQSFSTDYSSQVHHQQQQQQFVKPEPIPTTTTPTVSGSDPETTTTTTTTTTSTSSKQRRNYNQQQTLKGKISKRKSRATNRSPITFITADPMNFREMVQQVTGIRIGGGGGGNGLQMPITQIMKPEAKRHGGGGGGDLMMLMNGGYTLPTLDTSANFLLQQQQQQQQQQLMGLGSTTSSSTVTSPTHVSYHAPVVAQVNTSFDFDTFQSFPTLESWGVI